MEKNFPSGHFLPSLPRRDLSPAPAKPKQSQHFPENPFFRNLAAEMQGKNLKSVGTNAV
jgi:hypothetical protein